MIRFTCSEDMELRYTMMRIMNLVQEKIKSIHFEEDNNSVLLISTTKIKDNTTVAEILKYSLGKGFKLDIKYHKCVLMLETRKATFRGDYWEIEYV